MNYRAICTKGLMAAATGLLAGVFGISVWAAPPTVNGAAFTTFDATQGGCLDSPNGIDCNNYVAKEDVYMSGGPNAAGLNNGCYYFSVLVPGYQNGGFIDGADGNLSDTTVGPTAGDLGSGDTIAQRTFHVSNHQIDEYASSPSCGGTTGTHLTGTSLNGRAIIQLMPYDDTSNNGGVYILAVCSVGATSPSDCKYDAFRIPPSECVGDDCNQPPPPGAIDIFKFCDLNGDGLLSPGELGIQGWPMQVDSGATACPPGVTDSTGNLLCSPVPVGSHIVSEADVAGWTHTGTCTGINGSILDCTPTTDNSVVVDVTSGDTTDVGFGNVKYVPCGGKTMGFWSNPNGQAKLTAAALCSLNDLNLVNANGTPFNPIAGCPSPTSAQLSAGKTALKNWLLNATATNMAYMLSAQMAASWLDEHLLSSQDTFQLGGITIPAVCSQSLKDLVNVNVISISGLIADANAELASDPLTVAASDARTCQETKKNIFDAYNKAGEAGIPACNSCQ